MVLPVLRSRLHGMLSGSLVGLGYTGRRSGRVRRLPAMYARSGRDLVIVAADPQTKTWWRNFDAGPRPVTVLLRGRLERATACLPPSGDPARTSALAAYRARYPKARIDPEVPVLVVTPSSDDPGLTVT